MMPAMKTNRSQETPEESPLLELTAEENELFAQLRAKFKQGLEMTKRESTAFLSFTVRKE